jgi:DNA-binding beta-propeller fold protein YncE
MLFVTLHGGKPDKDPNKNNVHAYDKEGNRITTSVLRDCDGVTLNELRAIHKTGNYLYVANANRNENSVLCYEGAGTDYKFVSKFVCKQTCESIVHPFDFTFDEAGHCYVSSQDTNVVTRLHVSSDGKITTPAPIAQALPAEGKFSPGTFVASSVGNLKPPSTPVPRPTGLEYSDDGEKKHSVRGVIWANGALYVADQPARRVKVYDQAGKLLGQSNGVESPVHLAVWKGKLYVSGGDGVLTAELPNPPGDFNLTTIKGIKIKNASGMAFTDSGHFYVASRTENTILKFDQEFKPVKFRCELPDNPEFLLHV